MSDYILLERIKVENANCIAGVTYGFPAITHFLGFAHALSRHMSAKFDIEFIGCGVFCHSHQLNTHEAYDVRFVQTKTSPSALLGKQADAGKTPPIIEEGKMDMEVSILLKCHGDLSTNDHVIENYKTYLEQKVYCSRLAGGTILFLSSIKVFDESNLSAMKKSILPCFVLMDRSNLLAANHESEKLDQWTDFFSYKAKAYKEDVDGKEQIQWRRQEKPAKGWIVPLMIGYKGISPLYDAAEIDNLRDSRYPFRFVESVHGLGEWKGAYRLSSLAECIWQYWVKDEWYLCHQNSIQEPVCEALGDDLDDDFENLFVD